MDSLTNYLYAKYDRTNCHYIVKYTPTLMQNCVIELAIYDFIITITDIFYFWQFLAFLQRP